MSFELFTRKRKVNSLPQISISKYGLFVLNTAAVKHIKPHGCVEILWDQDLRRIGLKPSDDQETGYRLNKQTFSGSAFLHFIGYQFKEMRTVSFPAYWNESEQLLEFAIDKAA